MSSPKARSELKKPQIKLKAGSAVKANKSENRPIMEKPVQYHYLTPKKQSKRDLGSPLRLQSGYNASPKGRLATDDKLSEYYSMQINKMEDKMRLIVDEIQTMTKEMDRLYSEKLELKSEKFRLSSQLQDVEIMYEDVDRNLEYHNEELNKRLEMELRKYKLQLKEKDQYLKGQMDGMATEFGHKLLEVRNNGSVYEELQSVKETVSVLQTEIKQKTVENGKAVQQLENELSAKLVEKSGSFENELKSLETQLNAKIAELSAKTNALAGIKALYGENIGHIADLEAKLLDFKGDKATNSELLAKLRLEIETLQAKNQTNQSQLNIWELEYQKHRESHQTLAARLNKEKALTRKTEFAINSLLERLQVVIRTPEKSETTESQKRKVKCISLDDLEFCQQFDVLLDENFKCIKTSMFFVGHEYSSKPKFALLLLKQNFSHIKHHYEEKLVPKGWVMSFSLQYLAISSVENKIHDLISNSANGPEITLGNHDIIVDCTVLQLSLENPFSTFDNLAHLSIPSQTVPFSLIHIKGQNKNLAKSINSTCFMLDCSLNESHIIGMFEDIANQVNKKNYQSALYKNDLFIKQLIHSLYVNTESITTVNIKTQSQTLYNLADKINSVPSPPKKRTIRDPTFLK